MKTKLRRVSKRSISILLSLIMMLSIIAVGTVSAGAYTSMAGKIYFDNSKTKWTNVYLYVGHGSYAKSYSLTNTGSNNIWSMTFGDSFTDRTKLYFANHNDSPNGQSYGIDTQYGWNTNNSTRTALTTANNNDANSLFTPSSASAGTLTRSYPRVVAGDIASKGWDNKADLMTYSSSTYTKTYSNVSVGDYSFAVVGFDDWNTSYRWAAKGTLTANGAGSWADANDGDHNIKLTLTSKASVKITLNSSNKVNVTLTPSSHTASVTSQPSNGSLYVGTSSTVGTDTSISVAEGATYYIKATPATGYKLATLKVGSTSIIGSNTGATSAVTVNRTMGTSNETVTATFTAQTHTVTLNANGGSGGTSSVTATYGSAMPSATMPTRDGYTFAGYYDTSATSGGTQYYTAAGASARTWNKTSNTTLYARWTVKSYTISYTGDNVSYTTKPTPANYGSTVSFVVTASSPYVLGETTATYVDKNGTTQNITLTGSNGSYSFTMPAGNVTIVTTAVRTPRTVTVTKGAGVDSYVVNGSTYTANHSFTVSDGDSFTITSVTYSTGYENNNNTLSIASVTSNQTIALTGKKTSYSITKAATSNGSFTVTKGSTAATSANYGDTITITPSASTGYSVSSVKYNDGSDHTVTNNSGYKFTMPAHNVTVTVTFAETKYSVSVVSESTAKGTVASSSVSAGNVTWVTLPTATAKSGYVFDKWVITSGTGTLNNATSATSGAVKATGACTVTAKFTEIMNNITIQPYYEGTEPLGSVNPTSGTAGVATSLSISATARTGFAFTKWTSANSKVTFASNTAANTTITASAADTVTANFKVTRIYLDTSATLDGGNKFSGDSAVIKVAFGSTYVNMTKVTGEDDIWWADVPSGFTVGTGKLKFQRCNPSGQTQWNITGEITSSATKNMYKITSWSSAAVQDEVFIPEEKFDITINSGSGGTVTYNTTTEIAANSSETVQVGATARTIVATPQPGYHFTGWTTTGGAQLVSTSSASTNISAIATGTVTASFEQDVYNVTLSGSNCTLTTYSNSGMTTTQNSFNYNNKVYYKLTPASGYRITSIKVGDDDVETQEGTGEKTDSFTITDNTTITVTTVQIFTVSLKRQLDSSDSNTPFSTTQYRIGTSGSYSNYSSSLTVDAGSVVYFQVSYADGYEYNSITNASVVTANTVFKTSAINANTTVTLSAKRKAYSITTSNLPSGISSGNVVKFKLNNTGNLLTSTNAAKIGDTVNITVSTDAGYYLSALTATKNGNTTNIAYTGGGNGSNYTATYTMEPTMGDVTIKATFVQEFNTKIYIDMHDNEVGGAKTISVVTNASGTSVKKDSTGANCTGNLALEPGSSSIYSADVKIPVTKSGTGYNDLYLKVNAKINGNNLSTAQCVKSLNSSQITTLVGNSTKEIWMEAANEASLELQTTAATNSSLDPPSGTKRIFLAKPYSWSSSETNWNNIALYHWGDYNDIGWSNGRKMAYLGYDSTDGYYYYQVDVPSSTQNIIFQGFASYDTSASSHTPDAQTENIENIGSTNLFVLSKDGSTYKGSKMSSVNDGIAKTASFTRYYKTVQMNKNEPTEVSIKPTTSDPVSYEVGTTTNGTFTADNSTNVITVDSNGKITPKGSGTKTVRVYIYGTVGNLIKGHTTGYESTSPDLIYRDVTVTIADPTNFSGFKLMSLSSATSTVNIPTVSGNQPGYFESIATKVTGLANGFVGSAIVTSTNYSVSGVGSKPISYTVKYAASNNIFSGYSNIAMSVSKVVSQSIRRTAGDRYGHDHWNVNGTETPSITTEKRVSGGIETATTKDFALANGSTYSAIFDAYSYVDVTFKFSYYEYNTERTVDGETKNYYQYDKDWVGIEDRNAVPADDEAFDKTIHFDKTKHIERTYKVENFEVRNQTAASISPTSLRAPAGAAIVDMPQNSYYKYTLSADTITIDERSTANYTATVTVNLTHTPKTYKVYQKNSDAANFELSAGGSAPDHNYYYQEYADLTNENTVDWVSYNNEDGTNGPILATGTGYKFRVTGDTFLIKTAVSADDDDDMVNAKKNVRSSITAANKEITHEKKLNAESDDDKVEKLINNFYIADFFDPAKVYNPDSAQTSGGKTTYVTYDNVKFVGGGVMYYSMKNNTPNANVVGNGYVDASGEADKDALADFIKERIEENTPDSKVTDDVDLANEIAYGTEIKAQVYKVGDISTGLCYRYLPYAEFDRDNNGNLTKAKKVDEKGNDVLDSQNQPIYEYTFATTPNSDTFRYSNALQAYQYIYASKEENKATNAGKNMRVYAYYIYSHTEYDKDTEIPSTKYKVVVSDNYADASTYWSNPNSNS